MSYYDYISSSPLIEDRILTYFWDHADEVWREWIKDWAKAGSYEAMSDALATAACQKVYVPEELLKEAEEAAMEFIDFHHGEWAYFVLEPIEDIRENNAKLLAEGKIPEGE